MGIINVNVALMGSVSSSHAALTALIDGGVDVACVLGVDESQRDAICDYRSLRAVAAAADRPFCSFVRVVEDAVESFLTFHRPDLLFVIGLSQLVPENLIRIASCGGVGFHPTMLPQGRGRAPVAWTILRNAQPAVSLFYLTDKPDAGDIIEQRPVRLMPDDYSEDLIRRTNETLVDVLTELAPAIRSGRLLHCPQDESAATYYPKRSAKDGLIDWNAHTADIYRLVRAAGRPYHGAFTHRQIHKLIVWRASPADDALRGSATNGGCILDVDAAHGVLVSTGDGCLWLTEIEAAGDEQVVDVVEVGGQFA